MYGFLLSNTWSIFAVLVRGLSSVKSEETLTDSAPITTVNFSRNLEFESVATLENCISSLDSTLAAPVSSEFKFKSTLVPDDSSHKLDSASATTPNISRNFEFEPTAMIDNSSQKLDFPPMTTVSSNFEFESSAAPDNSSHKVNSTTEVNFSSDFEYDSVAILDNSSHNFHPKNTSEAVFASNFLDDCKYDEARDFLRVKPILGIDSYSGFITVSSKFNSNLFFWFILSEQDPILDPVIIWLMGYPGYSSMYGVFQENGPFRLVSGVLSTSNYSWTKRYNVLYIDNPVGIGFSFTENESGFSRTQEDISNNLYSFMSQFFEIFSQFRKNDLYIGAESYAGKFAISLAYKIHQKNPMTHTKMNLRGVFVGNGFVDPINMMDYSTYLYQLGIIDHHTFLWMQRLEDYIIRYRYYHIMRKLEENLWEL